ncbi:MAG: cyclic nucleotide-binding domain-containing protein [Elusimicrobia bacterium]|nr:cyclic nucleotide-binding domain-containing protein [Elusimicrobiota bacterium]
MTVTEFFQSSVSFLKGLTQDQAHRLAVQTEQLTFKGNQTVLFKGTTVDGLYVVAQGKVGVYAKPDKGKDIAQIAELGPGEVFGETSIMEMGTASATIKSLAAETLVFIIPQQAFRDVLAENLEFKARAEAVVASRKKPPKTSS